MDPILETFISATSSRDPIVPSQVVNKKTQKHSKPETVGSCFWWFKKPLKSCYSWSSGFPSGPGLQDVGSRQSETWRQTGASPRKIITCEPRKKRKRPYFPLCWLFKRNPYILVYYNPHIPVEYNPLYTLNLRVFSSLLGWKSFHKNPWNYHHTLS